MTDIKEVTELKENLMDEAGHLLRVQKNICGQLNQIFYLAGYRQGDYRNTLADTKKREWAWYNDMGFGVHFTMPKYHKMNAVRGIPIPGKETPEAAMVLPVDNHTDAEVTRNISREVKISTNARVAESNSFDFSVTAGLELEAGVQGTEGNFGATAKTKASLQTHFGMNFVSEWAKEKGNEVTRTVSDSVTLKPKSSYEIAVTVDRIEMEQEIKVSGILDFQMLIKTPNWIDPNSQDHRRHGNQPRYQSHITLEAEDMKALARQFIGMSGNIFADGTKKKECLNEKDYALQIGHFLSEDYRRVETVTKMRYNEAGRSTLVLERKELPQPKES